MAACHLSPGVVEAIKQIRTEKDEQVARRDAHIEMLRAEFAALKVRLQRLDGAVDCGAAKNYFGLRHDEIRYEIK